MVRTNSEASTISFSTSVRTTFLMKGISSRHHFVPNRPNQYAALGHRCNFFLETVPLSMMFLPLYYLNYDSWGCIIVKFGRFACVISLIPEDTDGTKMDNSAYLKFVYPLPPGNAKDAFMLLKYLP